MFVASVYAILYLETRRHLKKIRENLLPQEEVKRFKKENKAFKTTVFVVGVVVVCVLPVSFCFLTLATGIFDICPIKETLWQTCVMLNSLVDPLIYYWRQKEMRKLVLRIRTQAVYPAIQ